ITFYKCIPNPIRLLYVGYIASSPQVPHKAFLVGMVQLHHCLWQRTALLTNRFIKAMSDYINDQSHSLLFARAHHGKQAEHDLRKPFTYAVDLYWRILDLQQQLYEEGLGQSVTECYAKICVRCFGPAVGKVKESGKVPDFIVSLVK
ncbi:hypothetical protein CROQUDRAFT_53491, partial [Cronartium quercuum f. sp. fusiforme G11]